MEDEGGNWGGRHVAGRVPDAICATFEPPPPDNPPSLWFFPTKPYLFLSLIFWGPADLSAGSKGVVRKLAMPMFHPVPHLPEWRTRRWDIAIVIRFGRIGFVRIVSLLTDWKEIHPRDGNATIFYSRSTPHSLTILSTGWWRQVKECRYKL